MVMNTKLTIGAKLIIGFVGVAALIAVLALYSVSVGQKSLEESVGRSSVFLAEEMIKRMDQNIHLKIEELQKHTRHVLLQSALSESNARFEKLDSIEDYITQKKEEWTSQPKDEMTPFMEELIESDLSYSLRREFIGFYEKKYGYKVFAEVLVTNKYGANVAQTGITSRYRQDDEEWWEIAKEKDSYTSDIIYDESAGTHGLRIAVGIDDEDQNFVGVIEAIVAPTEILRGAEIFTKKYETTEIQLLTQDGALIYATKPFKFLEDVGDEDFFKKVQGEGGFFIGKEGGREKLFSYSRSKGYRDFEGLEWILLVSHDTGEVLGPTFILRNRILASSLILMGASVLIALLFSRSIAKPVTKLRDGALEIAEGNLNKKVEVKSKDEVGELSTAFNEMTSKLQQSYADLEREIEQRKKAEEKAQRLNRELEQRLVELRAANKELEAFSYSVSHDLRAPLRAIDGFSQVMLEDYCDKLDSEGARVLSVIRSNTQKMGQLIDDLLIFSRRGRQEMKKSKINMEKLARSVFEELKPTSPERNLRMKITALPPAYGDERMIREVLVNLLSNAVKFTKYRRDSVIEVGGKLQDNQNVYSVKDNGVGFDMQYVNKLFGVFQRLHSEEEFDGTGVGLALVQRIIHRHGGQVWAEGKLNQGATFYFMLPRKEG